MPERDQRNWTPYRVGPKSARANWVEASCQPLERVMHVTHVRHAMSVIDDGRIRRRPVYDDSVLTRTRIHVVWLSPNNWTGAGGSRYGNVEFGYEWRALIEGMNAYWIGAMDYDPLACRILLSRSDFSQQYLPYDPTRGDGPWWHELPADKHWWNGTFCLEIMVESDVFLREADGIDFTKHHARVAILNRAASAATPAVSGLMRART